MSAKEIFVCYNKDTGFVDGGIGLIDRKWDAKQVGDDSTTSKGVERILEKNPKRSVIFLPLQEIPEPDTVKIVDGNLVPLADGEETDDMIRQKHRKKIAQQIRKNAIKDLKKAGELPEDYKE